jgi:beta-glucanase (GH16 family)
MLELLVMGAFFAAPTSNPEPQWKLVWSDEFDRDGLPDEKKWDYEVGFIRNREMQYYTARRRENARIEDGKLIIEARRERMDNPRYDPRSSRWQQQREHAEYTSAALVTLDRFHFRYGKVVVRAKLPAGKGTWPAIWTLGTSIGRIGWPRCGEIDIMEFVGKAPEHVHGTVHYSVGGKKQSSGNKLRTDKPASGGFHDYEVRWYPDRIEWYFDDVLYHRFEVGKADDDGRNPFREEHYLLINLAMGGEWGGEIDDACLPAKFVVDSVRVYALDSEMTDGK